MSARFIYDPFADLMSDEMCFERVQKVRREEQPAFRVLPTQQRFHTNKLLIGQPDLRLIREFPFPALGRQAQLVFERSSRK